MRWIKFMEELKLDKATIKKFGITLGIAFLVFAVLLTWKRKDGQLFMLSISAIFFIFAFLSPLSLKLVYIFWMRLAFILGWLNTRIILFIIFYIIFTAIGIMMKLFGKDFLGRKLEKNRDSYWIKREGEAYKPLNYERQF